MIEHSLKLEPGQTDLTPEQQAEAQRFAAERIAAQLSTTPVDEQEAEAFLRQAYTVRGLPSPQQIFWLDSPVQLAALVADGFYWEIWDDLPLSVKGSIACEVEEHIRVTLRKRAVKMNLSSWIENRIQAEERLRASLARSLWDQVRSSVQERVWDGIGELRDSVEAGVCTSVEESVSATLTIDVRYGLCASEKAAWLALFRFFDTYLAQNELHAFAHFNERVSGYWLDEELALLVRRPIVLARDMAGWLHSVSGKCLEYQDGWGFYAWHGVRVPEKVILAPEQLTGEDWSTARNMEVRRVIQEQMGERFVRELGITIDAGSRGTLYEVRLPAGDPERVARYVQVQDASTARQYVLRVPPSIQTAAEAVAWSFQMAVEEYGPAHET